jgi:hypothetical protein
MLIYFCVNPKCGTQTSVTAGTVLHGTRKPLQVWFRAMWHITGQKYGANALGLQRVLNLGSYHTAWQWLHKLRRAGRGTPMILSLSSAFKPEIMPCRHRGASWYSLAYCRLLHREGRIREPPN